MSDRNGDIASYPEWDDLYDEIDPVPLILKLMEEYEAQDDSLSLRGQAEELAKLIDRLREHYLVEYWDWLCRSMPEGSDWRPHKTARRNWRVGEGPPFDYSAFRDDLEPWSTFFDAHFAKKISPTGNRARNPGRFRGDRRYPPLSKPALASIYHELNRWWRKHLALPFRPNFDGNEAADTDHARLPHLNPAARLFLLVAQAVDMRFTALDCARVAVEEARRQKISE